MTATITNLDDLCNFLSADTPALMNKRLYKATACGASISVLLTPEAYVALGPIDVWPGWSCCDGREYQSRPWMRTVKDRAKVARQEAAGVVRHKCPACGKVITVRRISQALTVPDRGAWIHNGSELWERLTRETPIVGFTIQTIVEGSEATVDSDLFKLPVTGAEIDGWIAQMESEAAMLWEEANAAAGGS